MGNTLNKEKGTLILLGSGILVAAGAYYLFKNKIQSPKKKKSTPKEEPEPAPQEENEPSQTREFDPIIDSEDEPLALMRGIEVKRDAEGVLSGETVVQILDKRSTIRGIRKLTQEFRDKRRSVFQRNM